MGQGLAFQIEQQNKKARQALRKRLIDMDWGEFEELAAELLAKMGFDDIELSPRYNDKGIDVEDVIGLGIR